MINGLLGKKQTMTHIFTEEGKVEPVTPIKAGPCIVTQVRSQGVDGYNALQIGFEEVKRANKAESGHLANLPLVRYLKEIPSDDHEQVKVGDLITVEIFKQGDRVDVIGVSKGKGFQGGVKRYGFSGGPKTHGQSDRHRAPGSVGAGTTPGRVIKGLKMAGHMGNRRVTVKNLEVMITDQTNGLVYLKGAVPGSRNSMVLIQKSK